VKKKIADRILVTQLPSYPVYQLKLKVTGCSFGFTEKSRGVLHTPLYIKKGNIYFKNKYEY